MIVSLLISLNGTSINFLKAIIGNGAFLFSLSVDRFQFFSVFFAFDNIFEGKSGKLFLSSNNIDFEIIHEDIQSFYESRLIQDYESRDFEFGSMGGYYTFSEIEDNLDVKYPQYFGEDKNYQDKCFINETDKDVYNWCENENETPIRFNEDGEIKKESEDQ